eukprot:Sspe_Gene.81849::Locus_53032_Transcript_1_1_Confidence_1.000_Length_4922::g.81849::m.81849
MRPAETVSVRAKHVHCSPLATTIFVGGVKHHRFNEYRRVLDGLTRKLLELAKANLAANQLLFPFSLSSDLSVLRSIMCDPEISWYSFRRAGTTMLRRAGFTPTQVAEYRGDSSIKSQLPYLLPVRDP